MSLLAEPEADVSKKKSVPPEPEREWYDRPKKPVVAQVRGSEEYKAWLEGLCHHDRRKVSDLVEIAVAQYADRIGYRKPQPPR